MKRHIKKIIAIALCVSMMQPALHAAPFGEFCRKWVSRATNGLYWYSLSSPAIIAGVSVYKSHELSEELKKTDSAGREYCPELKEVNPALYREVNEILAREGFTPLKNKIRVLSLVSALSSTSLLQAYSKNSAATAIDGSIIIPTSFNVEPKELAATLKHEEVHANQNHGYKKFAVEAVAPFALHGLYRSITPAIKYPSIMRSLMRIPGATAILTAAGIINGEYSKSCERDADASVRSSADLSRAMIGVMHYFKKSEDALENAAERYWNQISNGRLKENIVETMLVKNMSKEQYVSVLKSIRRLSQTHPWPSERIAYLEQWAKEAEAKKQQEENKK